MSNASAPRVAVYSGTFDPITLGHEDVIRRAAGLFDRLIVAVAVAHHKKTLFSLDERLAMVTEALADCPAVQVLPFEGLIMDFCR
ncbi:MAG: adenylyltransferase/cytidyltransferase family protein, partial [Tepidimonas taiwanensis]|nr:adenylyltransferase/cytidyltransferase family protein [Tepidimonas taiwanensis]